MKRRVDEMDWNENVWIYRKGQALWIDENIRFGKTESSLTFNNPPLSASIDFEIRVLEVYGFAGL